MQSGTKAMSATRKQPTFGPVVIIRELVTLQEINVSDIGICSDFTDFYFCIPRDFNFCEAAERRHFAVNKSREKTNRAERLSMLVLF